MRVLVLEVITVLISGVVLHAQTGSARIAGVVYDSFGAVVSQAEVQIKNPASGKLYQVLTSANGEYSIADLPAGNYDVGVIVHATRLYFQPRVAVASDKSLDMDVHLRLDTNTLGTIGDNGFSAAEIDRRPTPAGPTPRTPDGHPDFTGMWSPSRIIEINDPEMLPWAQAEMKRPGREADSPTAHCLPQGPILPALQAYKFIQAPTTIVILIEYVFTHRQIHLDAQQHPRDADPTLMGHSIGQWEGDTLVVDTTNFNDKSWIGQRPHTDKLHLIERFRRPDAGHLEYDVIAEDPGTFTTPLRIKFASNLLVGEDVGQYVCAENEQDARHSN